MKIFVVVFVFLLDDDEGFRRCLYFSNQVIINQLVQSVIVTTKTNITTHYHLHFSTAFLTTSGIANQPSSFFLLLFFFGDQSKLQLASLFVFLFVCLLFASNKTNNIFLIVLIFP